jgi:hypothetical protein
MHAVIRTYSGEGANELFDVIEKNKGEVEGLIHCRLFPCPHSRGRVLGVGLRGQSRH